MVLMKILIMDPVKPLDINGSMVHRWELAKNLANLGCEVHIITYTGITHERVYLHPLPKKSRIGYMVQLLKLVMKHRFDIIYTRNIPRGVIGILIKMVQRSKLILEVNGISLDEWRLMEERSTTEEKRLGSIQITFLGHLENFVSGEADAVIAVTQAIKDHLIDHGVDKNKVWTIENGANTELFKPINDTNILKGLKDRLCIDDDESVVSFVGNLTPWQGVEYLVQAAPMVIKENPKIKFLIVGSGTSKQSLIALCEILNVENNFIFTGRIEYGDVPKYINISDICIAPFISSRVCSPIKLFEYLSTGTPVVSSDINGVREILNECNAGILVTPENPTELSKAIIRLLKDKELREQLGKRGREVVINNYSWEITAKKTKKIFEYLLN